MRMSCKAIGALLLSGALCGFAFGGARAGADPLQPFPYLGPYWARPYIAPEFGPRFYLGDEDARLGRDHFINGNYGLAETYFRRAVEVTPQNGAAWVGLAASYDRLGRFDLAERAYRYAARLSGPNYVILNNHGYSYLLRGRVRKAAELLYRAAELAPFDPTVANNIAVLNSGQAYFWGAGPYILGWPPQ
jgi:tetratricopeptide (TPR) repeat protein